VPLTSGGSGIRTHGGLHLTAFQVRPKPSTDFAPDRLSRTSSFKKSSGSSWVRPSSPDFMARILARMFVRSDPSH
jgi:hypothetical protein